jgi:cytoskeletal protein RodZ
MEKKKIITIVIAVLAVILFLILLVSITKPKKTTTSKNNATPTVNQKTETKNEPKTESQNTEDKIKPAPNSQVDLSVPVTITGEIVSVTDQGLTLKTSTEELSLKFKPETMVVVSGGKTPPAPAMKDRSSLVTGKTIRVLYQRDTMEINNIIVQ